MDLKGPDEGRLRVFPSTKLLDSSAEKAFDRLTRLAARVLSARVALMSFADEQRQSLKSALGLGQSWPPLETPLTRSLCQLMVKRGKELVIPDLREHREPRDNLAAPETGVVAYAGIPLVVGDEVIGAFSVVDGRPRRWSDEELVTMSELAASAVSEIELRLALRAAEDQRALSNAIIESVGDAILAMDEHGKFLVANEAARRVFADAEVGKPLPDDWARLHRSVQLDGTPLRSSDGALVRALRGERTDGLTFTLQAPEASEPVWVEASGRPVVDAAGNVVAGVAVYRDVNEKMRRVDIYTTLVRSIPRSVVALFDRELRCTAIDGGLARDDGTALADLLGHTMRDLSGLPAGDSSFDAIEALYRSALDGKEGSADYFDAPRGRVLELRVAPVRDAVGRINAGIVLALDRTSERRNEANLRRTEQINAALLSHLPHGAVVMVDPDLRLVAADGPILEAVLRRTKWKTVIGRTVSEVVARENLDEVLAIFRDALKGLTRRQEIRRRDRFMEVNAVPVFAAGGEVSHVIVFLYDVTDRTLEAEELRHTRDLLARERSLLSATLEHIADGVALLDGERHIVLANAAYAEMLALPRVQVDGMSRESFFAHLATLLEEPAKALERFALAGRDPEDYVFARPRRRILRRRETPFQLAIGGAILVTWQDVTAERDLLAERERQLTVDGLTGIANRGAAEAALHVEDARRRRSGTPLSVALFDIDHFKQVNDRYGHATGDDVLRSVAGALEAQARVTDLVARWGGEEFVAVLPGPLAGAKMFAERARHAVERMRHSKVERVTLSAGVAEIGPNESPKAALGRADERLYQAKQQGRNRVVA